MQSRLYITSEKYWQTSLLGLKIIQHMVDQVKIIRAKLKATQDGQKSYADEKHRDVNFEVGDLVFIKVSS